MIRPDPVAFRADLVVVHTAHAGVELDWVDGSAPCWTPPTG